MNKFFLSPSLQCDVWNKALLIFLLSLGVSFQKSEQQQDQGDPRGRVRRRGGRAGADPDREPAGICARQDVQGPHGAQDPVSESPARVPPWAGWECSAQQGLLKYL